MHAIGAPEATTAFELQVVHEGQEISPEVEVQQAEHKEPEEEVECPNHEPASFVKGKPRSILSLPFHFESLLEYVISIDAFTYRSRDETFAACYSILVQISYLYLVIESCFNR